MNSPEMQAQAAGADWIRANRRSQDQLATEAELIWYGGVASVARELSETLADLSRSRGLARGALRADAVAARTLLRWDIQEPALRLLSMYADGRSWVTELDRLSTQASAEDLTHMPLDPRDLLAERASRCEAALGRLMSGFMTVAPEVEMGEVLSGAFIGLLELLRAAEAELAALDNWR